MKITREIGNGAEITRTVYSEVCECGFGMYAQNRWGNCIAWECRSCGSGRVVEEEAKLLKSTTYPLMEKASKKEVEQDAT